MPPQKKLGIYWGSESISFVEVTQENPTKVAQGVYTPSNVDLSSTPNTQLPVFDEYTYISTIRKVYQDNKFGMTDVYLSLPTKDIIIRSFMIPWMKPSEVKSVVEFEAKKYIPFNLKDLAFSYYPLTIVEKSVKRIRLLFVAIRRDTLDKYTQILKQAGLNVIFSEPASMSLVKALLYKKLIKIDQRVAILQKDKTDAKVLIVDKGIPQFVRDFQLTTLSAMGNFQDEQDATKMKLFSELKISLEFYARQYSQDKIEEIIILSSQSEPELMRSLQQELGMNVRGLDLTTILGMASASDWGMLSAYGIVLADPKTQAVNFNLSSAQLDASKKKSGSEVSIGRDSDILTLQIAFVCAAIVALTFLFFNLKVTEEQKRVNLITQKHGEFASQTTDDIQSKIQANKDLIKAYKKVAISSEVTFFQRYLTESLPKGVWLKDVSVVYVDSPRANKKKTSAKTADNASSAQAAPANNDDEKLPRPKLTFTGYVFAEDANQQIRIINNYLTQLRNDARFADYFDEISLGAIQSQPMAEKTVSYFGITCK